MFMMILCVRSDEVSSKEVRRYRVDDGEVDVGQLRTLMLLAPVERVKQVPRSLSKLSSALERGTSASPVATRRSTPLPQWLSYTIIQRRLISRDAKSAEFDLPS